jgi:hypothetical protein
MWTVVVARQLFISEGNDSYAYWPAFIAILHATEVAIFHGDA